MSGFRRGNHSATFGLRFFRQGRLLQCRNKILGLSDKASPEETMRTSLARIASVTFMLACATAQAVAQSESYPNKPIRIITHSAAGGAPDVMLRIAGERLGVLLGQQIVV